MNYNTARAITNDAPFYVMQTDAKIKKNCFISLDEVAVGSNKAKKMVAELNKFFRTLKRAK